MANEANGADPETISKDDLITLDPREHAKGLIADAERFVRLVRPDATDRLAVEFWLDYQNHQPVTGPLPPRTAASVAKRFRYLYVRSEVEFFLRRGMDMRPFLPMKYRR